MSDGKDNIKYEFSEDENLIFAGLSKGLCRLGGVLLVSGLLFIAYLVISFLDFAPLVAITEAKSSILNAADYGLWIVIVLLVVYLGISVMHLAKPIGQIVKTSGADISNLMHFMKDMTGMVRTFFIVLVVICVLLAVSLTLLIFVF